MEGSPRCERSQKLHLIPTHADIFFVLLKMRRYGIQNRFSQLYDQHLFYKTIVHSQTHLAHGLWRGEMLHLLAPGINGQLRNQRVSVILVDHGPKGFKGTRLVIQLFMRALAFCRAKVHHLTAQAVAFLKEKQVLRRKCLQVNAFLVEEFELTARVQKDGLIEDWNFPALLVDEWCHENADVKSARLE